MRKPNKRIQAAIDRFAERFENEYRIMYHNDQALGLGAIASTKDDDRFKPIISLKIDNMGNRYGVAIFVTDRNGQSVLTGDTAAIFDIDNIEDEDFFDRFDAMLEYTESKYGQYNKKNRLDMAFH